MTCECTNIHMERERKQQTREKKRETCVSQMQILYFRRWNTTQFNKFCLLCSFFSISLLRKKYLVSLAKCCGRGLNGGNPLLSKKNYKNKIKHSNVCLEIRCYQHSLYHSLVNEIYMNHTF